MWRRVSLSTFTGSGRAGVESTEKFLRTGGNASSPTFARSHHNLIVVSEGIVPFGEQTLHCVAGRNARHKPERELNVRSEGNRRVGKLSNSVRLALHIARQRGWRLKAPMPGPLDSACSITSEYGPLPSGPDRPTVQYLGSKAGQADWIGSYIRHVLGHGAHVADLFSGTGSVSAALKSAGLTVLANDQLVWAFHAARCILLNDEPPPFANAKTHGMPLDTDRYDEVLRHLNGVEPQTGFIAREYSPAMGGVRRYLTAENASRVDAIRSEIASIERSLTPGELSLLITDLIRAVSRVSNTAGTYGSYLKRWKRSSLAPLQLTRSSFTRGADGAQHQVTCSDANTIVSTLDVDAVYADPPYTKRQYAAYYHLLETIAVGDQPQVTGSTGLRPWEHLSSPYCAKRFAPDALADLVYNSPGQHFFLSYNDDGQIAHPTILGILGAHGSVRMREIESRRYKSSSSAVHRGPTVTERFYHLRRGGEKGRVESL